MNDLITFGIYHQSHDPSHFRRTMDAKLEKYSLVDMVNYPGSPLSGVWRERMVDVFQYFSSEGWF